jgi:hypothetical protein
LFGFFFFFFFFALTTLVKKIPHLLFLPLGKRDEACLVPGNDDTLILLGGWTGRFDPTDLELTPWAGDMHIFDLRDLIWHRVPQPAAAPPPCYGHRCIAVRVGVAIAAQCWAEVAPLVDAVAAGPAETTGSVFWGLFFSYYYLNY